MIFLRDLESLIRYGSLALNLKGFLVTLGTKGKWILLGRGWPPYTE